jgi:2-keto-4-pentenoate hydratase/2-oxohepta-3-ene-1,7-dioic acid hydratase in catechol pathway
LIFNIPRIISFLSRGTTLKAGTLILTGVSPHPLSPPSLTSTPAGSSSLTSAPILTNATDRRMRSQTPAGIGWFFSPKETLHDGDQFTVEISGGLGSLINLVEFEK